jgi:DNA-binding IclR family transcriptional regulator
MATTKSKSPAGKSSPKPEGKKDRALALLRRDGGATLSDIVEATGWLRHSARAVFTGLRKKGFVIEKQKADGTTRYSITAEPAA